MVTEYTAHIEINIYMNHSHHGICFGCFYVVW